MDSPDTQNLTRNFCIIAHIDHGKSTLCDRFMELTKTVTERELQEQTLDQMDLERERGITIKLQPVNMRYNYQNKDYTLNLIDTPGHVDFSYEVSRSLAAVSGALLLVDATQGIQAQTLANLYLAMEENLTIIPVINKIDLPNAQVEETKQAIHDLLGGEKEEILTVSAKTGEGVTEILNKVIETVPAPEGQAKKPPRALIFDSFYDKYKGVIAYIKMQDGSFKATDEIFIKKAKISSEILEVGRFSPKLIATDSLNTGQIGYIATGLKEIRNCKVGDTIVLAKKKDQTEALKGYQEVKPIVFASFYPKEGDDYNNLRDAL
jgi:GTP-binding protein LepA